LSAFIAVFVGLIFQNSWQKSIEAGENYFNDGDFVRISTEFYSPPSFRDDREMTQLATISGCDYRIDLIFTDSLTKSVLIPGEQAQIFGVFRRFDTQNTAAPWEFDDIFQEKIKNTIGEIEVVSIEKHEKMPYISKIYRHIRKVFEASEYNSFYVSLFTGDRSFLTPYIKAFFRESGLVHFLAISGLHIGILIIALSMIVFLLPLPKMARKCIVISAILFLPFLVGFGPATLRAVIMGTLLTVSPIFNRQNNALNSLFVTFFIILSIYPMHVFLIGFQYSFCATLAVLILPKLIGERKYKNEIMFIVLPVFLFLVTTPIQIFHFGTLTSASIIANIIMLPVLTIICQASLISIFVPFDFVSKFILFLCDAALDVLLFSINRFVILSELGENYTQISPFVFILTTVIIVIFCVFRNKYRFIYAAYFILAFIMAFLLFDLCRRDTIYTVSSQNFRMKVYDGKNPTAVILGGAQTKNYYNPAFRRWLKNRLDGGKNPTVYTDESYIPQGVFKGYTHIVLKNATGEIRFDIESEEQKTEPIAPNEKKRRKTDVVKKYVKYEVR
jgi:ComEC/Rec2-related protein